MTLIPSDGRLHYIWDKLDFVKLLSPMFGHINLRAWLELEKRLCRRCHLPTEPYLQLPMCLWITSVYWQWASQCPHSLTRTIHEGCVHVLTVHVDPKHSCCTVSRAVHTEVTWILSTHLCTSSMQNNLMHHANEDRRSPNAGALKDICFSLCDPFNQPLQISILDFSRCQTSTQTYRGE